MRADGIAVRIVDSAFDAQAEARSFAKVFAGSGAIVTFLGQVRSEGGSVEALSLEHYPGFTEREVQKAVADARRRWPLDGALIIHRIGRLVPEEPIVFVAVASAHRRAAFEAIDFLMDYLKCDAPFWKHQISDGEAQWIDPRAEDYAAKSRWNVK